MTRSHVVVGLCLVGATLAFGLLILVSGGDSPALASHSDPNSTDHAAYRTWAVGANGTISGFDPHETVDDVDGLTNHVGAPAMVTSMENTRGGCCGFLWWNPDTNLFKTGCVTGGFQFAMDLNRSTPAPPGSPSMTFGGGDSWATVNGNSGYSPYVNFRGTDLYRRWTTDASSATGIRVNPATNTVYFGDFNTGRIFELGYTTNALRRWAVGCRPYNLALVPVGSDLFVFATCVSGGGQPDQIVRLNPATHEVKRWPLPVNLSFQQTTSFGTPNSIFRDQDGMIWFSESLRDRLGRLNPVTDQIDEFLASTGVDNPHSLALSGAGATQQVFFTEASPTGAGAGKVTIMTIADVAPTSTTVTPTTSTATPTTGTAVPTNQTTVSVMATIAPVPSVSLGIDPLPPALDFVRFPIPSSSREPTGTTRVWRNDGAMGWISGSMHGTDQVFELVSPIILGDPDHDEAPPILSAVYNPACISPATIPAADGTAADNRPSEDSNSNGFLDPGEDLDNDGSIDRDTGVSSVMLGPGSVNTTLTVDPFVPGDGSVGFNVARTNSSLPGIADVRSTDGAMNTSQLPVALVCPGSIIPTRTTTRRATGTLPRPSPTTTSGCCMEVTPPIDPITFMCMPFVPFTTDPLVIDIDLSGDGERTVCCQYMDASGVKTPPVCQTVTVEPPPPGEVGRSPLYWEHQCDTLGYHQHGIEEMFALFDESSAASGAFTECAPGPDCRQLQTLARDLEGDVRPDRYHLMILWLNVQAGFIPLDLPRDLMPDSTATTVAEAIAEIEAILCDPMPDPMELERAARIAQRINRSVDFDLATNKPMVESVRGTSVSFMVGLFNMSPGTGSYDLTAAGDWPVTLASTTILSLPSAQLRVVTATVAIPVTAGAGEMKAITVTGSLQGAMPVLQRTAVIKVRAMAPDAPPAAKPRTIKLED